MKHTALLIITVCTLTLCGCKTKYVTVPERHTRDSIVSVVRHDSVYQRDSVFQTVFTRGDTVFSEKYIRRDLYREVLRIDTLRVAHRDTVYLRQPSAATSEGTDSEPAWYYRAALRFTLLVVLAMVAAVVAWIVKRKKT